MKAIINADDCGISQRVDLEIRRFIEQGLISSTTVMSNMNDFDGACQLYNDFHNDISFGIHFNLTEGTPLCYSQLLLDSGYYTEKDNSIIFNEKHFDYNNLTKEMKVEIRKELTMQLQKLLDYGFVLSHFDSHRHVHFHRQILSTFCKVANDFRVTKFRRYTNISETIEDKLRASLWRSLAFIGNYRLKTTDFFCGATSFMQILKDCKQKNDSIYEVMCHPGHEGKEYVKENILIYNELKQLLVKNNVLLKNYNNYID